MEDFSTTEILETLVSDFSSGGYFNNSSGYNQSGGGYFNSAATNSSSAAAQYLQTLMPNSTFIVYQTPTSSYSSYGTQNSYAAPVGVPPNLPINPMPWVEPTVSLSKLKKEVQSIFQEEDSMKPYNEQLSGTQTKREIPFIKEEDHIAHRRLMGSAFDRENTNSSLANSLANPLRFTEQIYKPIPTYQIQKPKLRAQPKRETIDEAMAKQRAQRAERSDLPRGYINRYNNRLEDSLFVEPKERGLQNFNNNQDLQNLPRGLPGYNSIKPEMADPDRSRADSGIVPEGPAARLPSTVNNQRDIRDEMESLIPILTKPGYSTKPSLDQLRLEPAHRLRSLPEFEVFNEHGSLYFVGPVDVTETNLDRDVLIDRHGVEVYPDELYREGGALQKPVQGEKLNRRAIITLANIPPKFDDFEANQRHYTKGCERIGAEFLNYDRNSKQLTFQVEHFTKYGFDTEEDDQEETTNSSQKALATSNQTVKTVTKPRQKPQSVPLLLQLRQDAPAPKPTPQGQPAAVAAVVTIEDCDQSSIQGKAQSDIASGFDFTTPRSRNIPLTKFEVQDKEKPLAPPQQPKTINELLDQLEEEAGDLDIEEDPAIWGIEQPNADEGASFEDVVISIPERQLQCCVEREILMGKRESKSPFQRSDFLLENPRAVKPSIPNKSKNNQERVMFDALKTVGKVEESNQLRELPAQHGFGIEQEVLERLIIVRKDSFPPNTWTALYKSTQKFGTLSKVSNVSGQTFAHPSIEINPAGFGNRYVFTPSDANDKIDPSHSFGRRTEENWYYGSHVPNLFKIPIYIAQNLDSHGYTEAILFELVNILFAVPRLRLRKAKTLDLPTFLSEIEQLYLTQIGQNPRRHDDDQKRYFGLLISSFLRKSNSSTIYKYEKVFEAEDSKGVNQNIFAKSTMDYGSRIENLENSLFGTNQAAQNRGNPDKLQEFVKKANRTNFFEFLISVLAQSWQSYSLADIIRAVLANQPEPKDFIEKCTSLILQCWLSTTTKKGLEKISEPITKLKHLFVGWELLVWILIQFVLKNFANIPQGELDTIKHTFKGLTSHLQEQTRIADLAAVLGNTSKKFSQAEDDFLEVDAQIDDLCKTFSKQLLETPDLRLFIHKFGVPAGQIVEAIAHELVQNRKEDQAIKMLLDHHKLELALVELLKHFQSFTGAGQQHQGQALSPLTRKIIGLFCEPVKQVTFGHGFLESIRRILQEYFTVKSSISKDDGLTIQATIRTFLSKWESLKRFGVADFAEKYPDVLESCDQVRTSLYSCLISDAIESCCELKDKFPDAELGYLAGVSTLITLLSENHDDVRGQLVFSNRFTQQIIQTIAESCQPLPEIHHPDNRPESEERMLEGSAARSFGVDYHRDEPVDGSG